MIKSVGKHTYGTDSYTTTVREFISYVDPTRPSVHIGSFTGIGLGCRFFPSEGVAHNPKACTNYAFGNLGPRNEIFNNIAIPPKVQTKGDINIGSDVWFGESVTVMSGVTVGHGAVVATNSHVFKDIEPYAIYGGNPAKLIKFRFDKKIIDSFLEMKWWDLPDEMINKILPLLQQEPTMEIINQMNQIIKGGN
jgi:acetyltransferase-like isoleucine patch superfamily enzyme